MADKVISGKAEDTEPPGTSKVSSGAGSPLGETEGWTSPEKTERVSNDEDSASDKDDDDDESDDGDRRSKKSKHQDRDLRDDNKSASGAAKQQKKQVLRLRDQTQLPVQRCPLLRGQ